MVQNVRLKSWTAVLTSALVCALVIVPPDLATSTTNQKLHARRTARRKPFPSPPAQVECGSGTLTLSSPQSSQGSLLLLELRTSAPLAEVKGTWDGKEIPFWQEPPRTENSSGASAGEQKSVDLNAAGENVSDRTAADARVPGANTGDNKRAGQKAPDENAADAKAANGNAADAKPSAEWRALLGVDLEMKAAEYPLNLTAKTADSTTALTCGGSVAVKEGKFATESLRVAPNFVQPSPEQLARAEAERERLRAIFATITPERLWAGSFRIPLDGVTTGGNFGKRRILNGTPGSPHSGVDFPAPSGTPIYAAQRGRVVLAEPLYFSGNTVVIDHGLGLYTFYGHMESIDAKVGDLVETGALLGKVGATGRVTGPHLHWGLTVNRSRVNPLQLVSLLSEPTGHTAQGLAKSSSN
jgi:murein DD-endopeptidase MepM/ murein hydrolase activator NlpD